ncbi:pseudouridine synthase [Euryhalocaulis caribicus]|uniref:pseudouridine synthase n=1 Tax=Euryhalocaulis caribicus TaxID=1161401 RepID=UPI0003A1BE21|nr:pseudouridine synthase [Euryhalocaulis caribicus]
MTDTEKPAGDRIAKVIARAGIASRRDSEKLITEGRVTVNGKTIKSPALNVTEDDEIAVDGELLKRDIPPRLWRYHKPEGLLTTHKDPEGRKTVFDSLPAGLPRVISVGRLDMNSEGLMLLTNDGDLARLLEHPSTGWTRRYRARAFGRVTQARLDSLKKGVEVDGVKYGPVEAKIERETASHLWITVAIKEGKNREVRKVLDSVGLKVNRLIRTAYGPFQLGSLGAREVDEVARRVLKDQLPREFRRKL